MKLFSPAPRRSRAAFTMVEIALCLAIIGFALVAIIGVLPVGLNVQKENREETIINQDAGYFMDAIRNGARGLDDLTNYVLAVTNYWSNTVSGATGKNGYTYYDSDTVPPFLPFTLTNGYRIVGLLSTPQVTGDYSNRVVAYVRALSGAATEKFPQDNASVKDLAFNYRIITEIVPVQTAPIPVPDTNSVNYATDLANFTYRQSLTNNLREVRLRFLWPLFPNGSSGNGRQTYRSLAGGAMTNDGPFWFFQPAAYATAPVP
jgi:type II secretory pathway pseudopilin PulG